LALIKTCGILSVQDPVTRCARLMQCVKTLSICSRGNIGAAHLVWSTRTAMLTN